MSSAVPHIAACTVLPACEDFLEISRTLPPYTTQQFCSVLFCCTWANEISRAVDTGSRCSVDFLSAYRAPIMMTRTPNKVSNAAAILARFMTCDPGELVDRLWPAQKYITMILQALGVIGRA